jgi:N-acetylglucosaminyldiphosphoundecaprenol N-acetyl-beta-D-mannosaminyltransferase
MNLAKYNFQGLNISIFTESELNKYIEELFYKDYTSVAYGYSLGIIPKLKTFNGLLKVSNESDLLVTDGRLFYLFLKLFGVPVKFDISIPNLVFKCLNIAEKNNANVFFLGGTETANSKALMNVRNKYPALKKVTGHHGYWSDKHKVIDLLKSVSPDIIFLTLPTPDKEVLAAELKALNISKLIIPCGGMIDVLAGDKKISPRIIKNLGLAWFYRFIQEPKVRYKLLLDSTISLIKTFVLILFDKVYFKKNDAYKKYIE